MNNNENAEYNNTLHFHVYNILCLHIIDNLTNFFAKTIDFFCKIVYYMNCELALTNKEC